MASSYGNCNFIITSHWKTKYLQLPATLTENKAYGHDAMDNGPRIPSPKPKLVRDSPFTLFFRSPPIPGHTPHWRLAHHSEGPLFQGLQQTLKGHCFEPILKGNKFKSWSECNLRGTSSIPWFTRPNHQYMNSAICPFYLLAEIIQHWIAPEIHHQCFIPHLVRCGMHAATNHP